MELPRSEHLVGELVHSSDHRGWDVVEAADGLVEVSSGRDQLRVLVEGYAVVGLESADRSVRVAELGFELMHLLLESLFHLETLVLGLAELMVCVAGVQLGRPKLLLELVDPSTQKVDFTLELRSGDEVLVRGLVAGVKQLNVLLFKCGESVTPFLVGRLQCCLALLEGLDLLGDLLELVKADHVVARVGLDLGLLCETSGY